MADLTSILNQIRTAVFGKDVRESIAQGIEECNSIVTKANTASASANLRSNRADTTANEAKTIANSAVTTASSALSAINNMTAAASTLQPGSQASVTVSNVSGHKHVAFGIPKGDRGKDFRIAKTFVSISAMNSYSGTDIEDYDFVMISSDDPDDPDNGKLYYYLHTASPKWQYIGNISGAQGIKGDTGNGIYSTSLNNDYTLTISYTDGTSVTLGPIKGDTGDVPNISIGTVTTIPADQGATVTRRAGSPNNAPIFDFQIPRGDVSTNFMKQPFNITVSDWTESTSAGVTTYTKNIPVIDVTQDTVYWVSYTAQPFNVTTSIGTDIVIFSTTSTPTDTLSGDIIVAKEFDVTVVNSAEGVDF